MEIGCVAITRDGWGDVWQFANYRQADVHPIVQLGDPKIAGPERITREIPIARIPTLMRMLGSPLMEERVRQCIVSSRGRKFDERRAEVDLMSKDIWSIICRAAKEPPEDPTTVINIIRRDRVLSIQETKKMEDQTPDVATPETAADEVKPTKRARTKSGEPKPPKEPKEPRVSKHNPEALIRFGKNAEGVPYGPENNPKRAGSSAAERFGLYRDGMTVKAALDSGVDSGDVTWDISKGFISLEEPAS